MTTRRAAALDLGAEYAAWIESDTKTEPEPYIWLRRALCGATLKLATQWANSLGVPFVRPHGSAALVCRRSDFKRAAAAYEEIQKARAAMEADDDEWTGANPPPGMMIDLLELEPRQPK